MDCLPLRSKALALALETRASSCHSCGAPVQETWHCARSLCVRFVSTFRGRAFLVLHNRWVQSCAAFPGL